MARFDERIRAGEEQGSAPEVDVTKPSPLARAEPAQVAALPRLGADRAAAYMAGLQRSHGNAALARMLSTAPSAGPALARSPAGEIPLPGYGEPGSNTFMGVPTGNDRDDTRMWYGWSARWTDSTDPAIAQTIVQQGETYSGTLSVKAGTKGTLRMAMQTHFVIDLDGDENQYYRIMSVCSWDVEVEKSGTIKLGTRNPERHPIIPEAKHNSDEAPYITQSDLQVQDSAGTGEFTITPVFQARQTTKESTSGGWNVDVKPYGVGFGKGGQDDTKGNTTPAGSLAPVTLKIKIVPDNPEGPQVELGKVRTFAHRTHDVEFFREGNIAVSAAERQKVIAWFFSLRNQTRKRLKAGTQKIKLQAFASNLGSAERNHKIYAAGRERAVRDILDRFVDENAWDSTAIGEDLLPEDRPGHEQPDPSMLQVHLKVLDEDTPGAEEDDDNDLLPQE